MMLEVVTAVDYETNNKQLINLKASKVNQQRMKSYNNGKIMSIVALSQCQAHTLVYPHI